MTLDEFIKKYDSKGIDYDGAFSTQCVDLFRQYVKEVLEYPQSPPVVGAKDIWDTYLPEYYQRIENTPYGVPDKGDIIIFGTTLGKYGHVAVFIDGTASKFTSFDQNFPSGTPCHVQGHTYSAVKGWLRPITKNMDLPEWFTTLLLERNLSLEREGEFREFWGKAIGYDEKVKELQNQIISTNEALSERAGEVSVLTEENQKLRDERDTAREEFNKERDKFNKADWELTQEQIKTVSLEENVKELQDKLEGFKEKNDLYSYSWFERFISLLKRR